MALLALPPRAQLRNLARLFVDEGIFLLGEVEVVRGEALAVHASGEAPLNIVDGCLLKVVLNVMEGVLRDVCETHVGVAHDRGLALVLVWLDLADHQLDEG
eukprot:scaffold266133_cov31-Tisochrysis_lutea.AAC.3